MYVCMYHQNYKEFEAEIFGLQKEIYGLSFDIKKCTTSGWACGDENVIGITSFNGCLVKDRFPFSNFAFFYRKIT